MGDYRGPYRVVGTSAANAPITVFSPVTPIPLFLKFITVKYSGSQASTTVTVTVNSGAGAAYDVVVNNIVLTSAVSGFWIPSFPFPVAADDTIDVLAPAGGVGVTASVAIYADRAIS